MNRTIFSMLATLVLLGFPGGVAAAQGIAGRSPVGGVTSAGATATAISAPISEPAEMSGMLVAQNDARAGLGVPALTWSSALAIKAATTATSAAAGSCPLTTARKAGDADMASIFWAVGLRRVGGVMSAQDISPSYLVSRWREGASEYNAKTNQCRTKGGDCDAFSRMVAPKARTVGCARAICPNQTQIWACLYKE